MMQPELPQASIVRELVEAASKAVPFLTQNKVKRELMNVLASFDLVSVPSVVGLDEVRQYIALHGIKVDDVTAREILTKIALDIDLNYVNSAVQYHADEFISSCFDKD
jgi:hypothetical protein